MKKLDQKGIVDMMIIAIVVAVVAAGGVAYWRISSSDSGDLASVENVEETSQLEALPANLEGIKSIDEIEAIVGVGDDVGVVGFVLETKDDYHVYIVTLSNGKKYIVHATTGEILSEEDGEVLVGKKLATAQSITVNASEAYAQAAAMSTSAIVQIELEIEDDSVTYKVEFKDGSKVEIDALSGAVVKTEIKNDEREPTETVEPAHEDPEEDEYEEPEEEEYEEPGEKDHEDESNS